MAKANTVTRRIIALVIENAEMSSAQIIAALHGKELHWSTPEAKRTRVSLHSLCENGWLKTRARDGVRVYCYAKRRPPRDAERIHSQAARDRTPQGIARLNKFLSDWVAKATATDHPPCD